MLRINQSVSAKGALRYFDDALAQGDYYSEDERSIGVWGGRGAELLGLKGPVRRQDFAKLTANVHPVTGENLTPRTKENRTAGYDFTFSVPKSVSIYLALEPDSEVRRMVTESFTETMAAIEAEMKTRVRGVDDSGKQRDEDRTTGNAVWATFVHDTTRPVDGMPDPHLHIHAYVLNATFDEKETRWKAGLFRDLVADKSYWEASFNARLANRLAAHGYGIRRTQNHFELASVERSTIEKFSRRTQEIERQELAYWAAFLEKARVLAEAKDISRFEAECLLVGKPGAKPEEIKAMVLAEIGAKSRESKNKGELDAGRRLEHWKAQMTPEELKSLSLAVVKQTRSADLLTRQEAQDLAINELFERSSVIGRRKIAALTLRKGIGSLSVREADRFAENDSRLVGDNKKVTTHAVLKEERLSVKNIKAGKGSVKALDAQREWSRQIPSPTDHQKAVAHLLETTDQFSLIRGRAGTGKTTMMKSAVQLLEQYSGQTVAVFAPSSSSTEELRNVGFENADTFQMLEKNLGLQEQTKGKIIWIDEAGFLGAKQMAWLTEFARENALRVILSGDSAQHHAVERGDSLRVLEASDALEPVSLTEIFRQTDPQLKSIVKNLSEGYVDKAIDALIAQSRMIEIEEESERLTALVDKHLEGIEAGKQCLIVAPTHAEGRAIATRVRAALLSRALITEPDVEMVRLQNTGWTEAQRSDRASYQPGQVVEFHRRCAGFGKNDQWEVKELGPEGVIVSHARRGERILPLDQAHSFAVYTKERLALAVGDTVRLTKNHHHDDHRFINNDVLKVARMDGHELTLSNGKVMDTRKLLHLDQGHVVTSHSSQGRTVDQVLVSVPISTFNLVNTAQFYVSLSRARETALAFTESGAALREAVAENLSERLSALELIGEVKRPNKRPRPAKAEKKAKQLEQANQAQQDRVLLAKLYKAGRLRPAKDLPIKIETLQRLLVVLDENDRVIYEPTILRRLAALARAAQTAENRYNAALTDQMRKKGAQITRIECLIEAQRAELAAAQASSGDSEEIHQRMDRLSARLGTVHRVRDGHGLYATKVEELAEEKLRRKEPQLAKERDAALATKRRSQAAARAQTISAEQVVTRAQE
jgi:conjugative relaxase-like TrwC/TraI family protein